MNTMMIGPALSTRGNLSHARARGTGPPWTVEHRYLPDLGRYRTLAMRAKEYGGGGEDTDGDQRQESNRKAGASGMPTSITTTKILIRS